jgi:hypothetical protein
MSRQYQDCGPAISIVAIHFRIATVRFLHCMPTFGLATEIRKPRFYENYLNSYLRCVFRPWLAPDVVFGEKFEKISQNPSFSIINWLFIEIVQLFLKFILGIDNFLENRSDLSLKFFNRLFPISIDSSVTSCWFFPFVDQKKKNSEL